MTRVYEHRGFFVRQNISLAVLAVVLVYGFFELWRAFSSAAGDQTGAMFGVLFLAGSVWGFYRIWMDGRDVIAALDADPSGRELAVTLWGPFTRKRLVLSRDDVAEWRFWVKPGPRGQPSYSLHLITRGSPRPLQIELRRGQPVADGLRRLAPAAIEEFETATKAPT